MLPARKKVLTILFIGVAVAAALASAKKYYPSRATSKSPPPIVTRNPQGAPSDRPIYVRSSALQPKLRWNLKALGNRLEHPGKEQMIIHGALRRAGVSSAAPVVLNMEVAKRMTLSTTAGIQKETIAFDGTLSSLATVAKEHRDVVETFLFDTAENFFLEQMKGAATRCLGYRFRADEQTRTGPFHDIYMVTPTERSGDLRGAKLFYFNSDTLLLDRITYQTTARVEVRLSNWQDINGQKVAFRIERLENGTNVMTLTIDRAVFAPAAHPQPK